MSLDTPTYRDIINSQRGDLSSELPELDPTVYASFARAFVEACGGRAFDIVLLIEALEKALYPDTATGTDLDRWAGYEALTRTPATYASGPIVITGVATTLVPIDSELSNSDGNLYTTMADLTLSEHIINVSSMTRVGSVVTVNTTSDHSLASNITVTIAGANESDYNGDHVITVTDSDVFTFTISTTPTTPATGTITSTYTGGLVSVASSDSGSDQNAESGAKLTFTSSITDVDNDAYVSFNEIAGGEDAETDTALRARVYQSRSAPVANFNAGAIEKVVLSTASATRVFVKEVTPEAGDVTIYFVNDNADSIIPTTTDINAVKDAVLEIKPAHTSDYSVIVSAPTPVTTDFTFASIDPNTDTMKDAIIDNLTSFYQTGVEFETSITTDKYRAAIIDTIDPETGDELLSFTLTTPSGIITVSGTEIGVLGNITFN